MRKLPYEFQGNTPTERAHNEVVRYLKSLRPMPSPGDMTQHTIHGTVRRPMPVPNAAVVAYPFRVQSDAGDYLVCRGWDGATEGPTDINVAKPPDLWFSNAGETVRGRSYTYSDYDAIGFRLVFVAGGAEIGGYWIDPQYIAGSVIYACRANTFIDGIYLMDCNFAGRTWISEKYALTPSTPTE